MEEASRTVRGPMKRTPKSKREKPRVLVAVLPDPKSLMKRLGYGDYQQDPIDPFIFHPPRSK